MTLTFPCRSKVTMQTTPRLISVASMCPVCWYCLTREWPVSNSRCFRVPVVNEYGYLFHIETYTTNGEALKTHKYWKCCSHASEVTDLAEYPTPEYGWCSSYRIQARYHEINVSNIAHRKWRHTCLTGDTARPLEPLSVCNDNRIHVVNICDHDIILL